MARTGSIWLVAHHLLQNCFLVQRRSVCSGLLRKYPTGFLYNTAILLTLTLIKAFSYRDHLNPTYAYFNTLFESLSTDFVLGSDFWLVSRFFILYLCLVRIFIIIGSVIPECHISCVSFSSQQRYTVLIALEFYDHVSIPWGRRCT